MDNSLENRPITDFNDRGVSKSETFGEPLLYLFNPIQRTALTAFRNWEMVRAT
jgi:hypothetical protein